MTDQSWNTTSHWFSRRISTFFAVIAANKNYDIYLTSPPPNQMRFRILNADISFKVRLSLHYYDSLQRVDLYRNYSFVNATNAEYKNGNMLLKEVTVSDVCSYIPKFSGKSGENFFANKKMYFTIGGGDFIDLKVPPVIHLKIGVKTSRGDGLLVQNLASLLGVQTSQIRRSHIIKKSIDGITQISMTIYDNAMNCLKNESKSLKLIEVAAKAVNKFATGQLQMEATRNFNINLTSFAIKKPLTFENEQEISRIAKLVVIREANKCRAQVPCEIQPVLQVLDENVTFFFQLYNRK